MRSFYRHPTEIPLEVQPHGGSPGRDALRDISHGGLCFGHSRPLTPGAMVRVRIPEVSSAFEAVGRVVWCQADGPGWQIGVEFLGEDDLFRVRMVEQICQIEQYRRDQSEHAGRKLSGQDAAREWISKYAARFAYPNRDRSPVARQRQPDAR